MQYLARTQYSRLRTSSIPLVVQVALNPTANAFQIRGSTGGVLSGFTGGGRAFYGVSAPVNGIAVEPTPGVASGEGIVVAGVASQTAIY